MSVTSQKDSMNKILTGMIGFRKQVSDGKYRVSFGYKTLIVGIRQHIESNGEGYQIMIRDVEWGSIGI